MWDRSQSRLFLLAGWMCMAGPASARAPQVEIVQETQDSDPALAVRPMHVSGTLQDTVWIADWSFENPIGRCVDDGWERVDLRTRNDGSNHWSVEEGYGNGTFAAVLRHHDLCWARDGYGNDWDQSVVLEYSGSGASLSCHIWSDSEGGFDTVTIEVDSLGLSPSRIDFQRNPITDDPSEFRQNLLSITGDNWSTGTTIQDLPLPDYGPGVHLVYIRFRSDGGYSDEDGSYPSAGNAGMVVDDIVITGDPSYAESFECGAGSCLDPRVHLSNTASAAQFGPFARLYPHVTDNDTCVENTTCAWLWSDPTLPAYFPDMAFGPFGRVVRNWLDDLIISPWVTLAPTSNLQSTMLSFRRFPGNPFGQSRIVQGWRVRSRLRIDNTDTLAPGDSIDCTTAWGHAANFQSLSTMAWQTSLFDMTPYIDAAAVAVQVSFRVTDWQWIGGIGPPATLNPGPGPYLDRVRIGHVALTGPLVLGYSSLSQAQDCLATVGDSTTPGTTVVPSTDRFGSCAFSSARTRISAGRLQPDDEIQLHLQDNRQLGGIDVKWYGTIVAGPHAGKAPAPYVVGTHGFFEVQAERTYPYSQYWLVDLDDTYFRGGDVLAYAWLATDAGGGWSSFPSGLAAAPTSIAAAEAATGGLFEVSFLPAIDWDPAYLARIAADPHGDLDPTPEETAASSQSHCILYYQHATNSRRSSQKTSFMYTLDALGYAGSYDVYDLQGGDYNSLLYNQLASRATLEQLTGYRLIVEDDGRSDLSPNIPDGSDDHRNRVDQAQFYRDWLARGGSSEAGIATWWILGQNTVFEKATNPLFAVDCGIASVATDPGLTLDPEVAGVMGFVFSNGAAASFAGERFQLGGACAGRRDYDAYTPGGTAVATHVYRSGSSLGPAAVILNSNATLGWNTIVMGFPWFDIGTPMGQVPGSPGRDLAQRILDAVLGDCAEPLDPTHVSPTPPAPPRATVLHANVPNPFNPTTQLSFDLAEPGRVQLEIYDVAGHRVRTLVDELMEAGFGHALLWNGLDDSGRRLPSGIYLARLRTASGPAATRRLVLLK